MGEINLVRALREIKALSGPVFSGTDEEAASLLAGAGLSSEMESGKFVDQVDLLKLALTKTPESVRFSLAICLLQAAVVQDKN